MLTALLRFLFPSRCILCEREGSDLCEECKKRFIPATKPVGSDTWALLSYGASEVKTLIHAYKYRGKNTLLPFMALMLASHIDTIAPGGEIIIVPIPSSTTRAQRTRVEHMRSLARVVVETYRGEKILTVSPLIEKRREGLRQVETKTRAERLTNLVGAFALAEDADVRGKTVLLLDDVTTTGATFAEARRALSGSGAKNILALSLAH